MAVPEVGRPQRIADGAALERQRLHQAHESRMGSCAGGGAALVGALADDHMGTDVPLRVVVVRWKVWNLQESQELMVMLKRSGRQAPQGLVPVRRSAPMEEAFRRKPGPMQERGRWKLPSGSGQAPGIREDPPQGPVGLAELLRDVDLGNLPHLPKQMGPALLLSDLQTVVDQMVAEFLRGIETLEETLVLLLEGVDLSLEFIDQRDQLPFGQVLWMKDRLQLNPPASSGSCDTLRQESRRCKKNLFRELN